ncbi:hypothetical protein ACMZOO_00915 [Catenovulum sp. SX2]|uniref:hypothetical protein n=1 Tax=Catenovulum sp. SX2 TaxID=3398614 RepID=UPI003F8714BD
MIKINKVGIIESGDNYGYQVKIIDDSENTGGCLVLTSKNFDDPSSEAFDDWVQNRTELVSYVEEANWVIKWSE